jgi:hypothetical protein
LLGLQISVHNTAVLLLPGLVLLAWLNFSEHLFSKKVMMPILLLMIPGLFYLYIPLRAEWLIAHYGRLEAIQRGLLADFYFSGLDGLIRYFSATDFTGGVVTNWGLVPQQFFTVYLPILVNNFSILGVGMGLIGGLALAWLYPRLFWPLFLIYATPIPFVLTYGQGEQSAFLLPSFLIFSIFIGNFLILVEKILSHFPLSALRSPLSALRSPLPAPRSPLSAPRFPLPAPRFAAPLLFLLLIPTLFLPQTHYNVNRLNTKWDRAMYDEWADALAHPLEPGAAMLAHWGDLTTFWYMQTAEGRRPDLLGLYPPTEAVVANYLATDRELYIAGPLQGWAAGIETRYQLLPWGRLVRIAPRQVEPQTLLPRLPQPSEAVFDNKLRLLGFDYPPQANGGSDYAVTLTWQALADLQPETTISLRLSQGDGLVTQLDDTLLSGWFPRDTLPSGQYILSYAPIPIPLGTLPGRYRLQLVAYTSYKHPWPLADGTTVLDLGEVEIFSPAQRPDSAPLTTIPGHDFNGEIELADYSYTVARVGQGKGFGVKLLWRAKTEPVDNYTLLVEAVDLQGNVIRAVEHQPVGGAAPTASWQAGQYVRDQVDLVLPANAPVGQKALQVCLSWLRPDGSKLTMRHWLLPVGDTLNLDWLEVTEKEGRLFEVPELQYALETNFEDKTRFLGYNSPQLVKPEHRLLQFSQSACAADPKACQIHFDFYWQGLAEMDVLYFVFLHVVDEQGQIVAQHDQGPGKRGKQPTTSWLPGEIVLDPVDLILHSDLPPGKYTLRLGMYLPPDGPRLWVWDDEGQPIADSIEGGMIEVGP